MPSIIPFREGQAVSATKKALKQHNRQALMCCTAHGTNNTQEPKHLEARSNNHRGNCKEQWLFAASKASHAQHSTL
jgi:hypothetical protein